MPFARDIRPWRQSTLLICVSALPDRSVPPSTVVIVVLNGCTYMEVEQVAELKSRYQGSKIALVTTSIISSGDFVESIRNVLRGRC